MKKEYCLLQGYIFDRVCTYEEYIALNKTNNFVYEYPPVVSDQHIAIYENSKWVLKRKSAFERERSEKKAEYRNALKEKFKAGLVKEQINKKYDEIPPYIPNELVPNFVINKKLKKEYSALERKLIFLYENKKRITKKLKIYKKDLQNKIKELDEKQYEKTNVELDANNQFSIIDVVPSKVPF